MSHFKGTPGPWAAGESFYSSNHASIDAPKHGAIAHVLTTMDADWSTQKAAKTEKEAELAANLRAVLCAPEMAEFILELHFLVSAGSLDNPRLDAIVAKLQGVK